MLRAELSPFHVTGAAEDLGRPSEELSRQQQRKGNAISALGRKEVKDTSLLEYSVGSVGGRS